MVFNQLKLLNVGHDSYKPGRVYSSNIAKPGLPLLNVAHESVESGHEGGLVVEVVVLKFTGAGANNRTNNPKGASVPYKSSTISTPGFTRGWKPVIDGKIQVSGETEPARARSSSMQSAPNGNGTSSSGKSSGTDNTSASGATNSVMEPKKDGMCWIMLISRLTFGVSYFSPPSIMHYTNLMLRGKIVVTNFLFC
jgi:hypothetical protein